MSIKGVFKSTSYWKSYWQKRQLNWSEAYFTPNHPHRGVIINKLKGFNFRSVLEVGCGAGANLYKIKQNFPWADVGGLDWNADAIEEAKRMLPRVSVLQVGEATDIYISNKGADIILSDMCGIYLNRENFKKAIWEAKRVARVGVIYCEFHHTNPLMRWLLKLSSGYNAYNWKRELKKVGFNDIEMYKLTEEDWPGGNPQKDFGWIISAKA